MNTLKWSGFLGARGMALSSASAASCRMGSQYTARSFSCALRREGASPDLKTAAAPRAFSVVKEEKVRPTAKGWLAWEVESSKRRCTRDTLMRMLFTMAPTRVAVSPSSVFGASSSPAMRVRVRSAEVRALASAVWRRRSISSGV